MAGTCKFAASFRLAQALLLLRNLENRMQARQLTMYVAFSCSLFQIVMHLALQPKIAKRDPHFFESLTQPSYIKLSS